MSFPDHPGAPDADAYASYTLDHHGLVAGMVDELGLVGKVDAMIPQDLDQRHVSIGMAVKAMILIGLGFVQRALYLTPDFSGASRWRGCWGRASSGPQHGRQGKPCRQKRAEGVHPPGRFEILLVDGEGLPPNAFVGVVDQHVDPAQVGSYRQIREAVRAAFWQNGLTMRRFP